jgi:hypothetical protein
MNNATAAPVVVGIDNGVSGALVALQQDQIIDRLPMPVHTMLKYGADVSEGRNQVNVMEVYRWLHRLAEAHGRDNVTVILEQPGGSKSASAAVSMAGSFHALRTVAELLLQRPPVCITPQMWQNDMLAAEAGQTKMEALTCANRLWPKETWLATPRSSTPHTGLVDAALIAWFYASGRFHALTDKCPKKNKSKKPRKGR